MSMKSCLLVSPMPMDSQADDITSANLKNFGKMRYVEVDSIRNYDPEEVGY